MANPNNPLDRLTIAIETKAIAEPETQVTVRVREIETHSQHAPTPPLG
ncbi:hypothetical protein CKA32_005050 [Geitlerinema sp. FC II]|nr:hypothetical protein [Geitlerinema sp. CS-897]PPT08397.1 hypothetical protein CKA32_005050 [Geitlerinema sp. FC II]